MGLLYNLVFAGKATSTHHKLALDALRHLQHHDAAEWQNVFLAEVDQYLKGSTAPDDEFKDFRNHVLHVRENFWGGAIGKAQEWYGKTVEALRGRQWPGAVYNAGVLSHYFTDPFQPFHTGQSEREMIVHRAAEWTIAKSYEELQALLTKELGGYPEVDVPSGDDWLAQLIRRGATAANAHYDLLIDHYNLDLGTKNPLLGYDKEARLAIAGLIGQAAVGFARVLDRAIVEAGVFVPHVVVGIQAMFESMQIPMRAVTKRMVDARERAVVEAMYAEYKQTGKVLKTLPEDDKAIRALHAEEVLKAPLVQLDQQKSGPIGAKFSGPAPAPTKSDKPAPVKAAPSEAAKPVPAKRDDLNAPKLSPFVKEMKAEAASPAKPAGPPAKVSSPPAEEKNLTPASPLVDAPSIGPKTPERFVPLGIRTVGEFLAASPEDMAESLGVSHITAEVLEEWQDQAQLVIDVPRLLDREAQILVAIGIRTADDLARSNARDLLELVQEFCDSPEGKRVLRDGNSPDLAAVSQWVVAAKKARLKAA
jgi:hypothetical protein